MDRGEEKAEDPFWASLSSLVPNPSDPSQDQTWLSPGLNPTNPSASSAAPEYLGSRPSAPAAEEERECSTVNTWSRSETTKKRPAGEVFPSAHEFRQRKEFQYRLWEASQQALASDPQPLPRFAADRSPAWAKELRPNSGKLLGDATRNYMEETQRLDQRSRPGDSYVPLPPAITQELDVICTTIAEGMESLKSLRQLPTQMNRVLWNVEKAVQSYKMLWPTSNSGASTQPTGAVQPVGWFEKYLMDYLQRLEELEELVHSDAETIASSFGLEMVLPRPKAYGQDFLTYLTEKAEYIVLHVNSMRAGRLIELLRPCGASAKQEAGARMVHQSVSLPATRTGPSTQVVGLVPSSASPFRSAPQPPGESSRASSAGGFSFLSTPLSSGSASILASAQTASAPSSSLFRDSGFSAQSTPFVTASTSSFGVAQTPSLFGASTPSFASTSLFDPTRASFLPSLRRQSDWNDLYPKADRHESVQQEAAARMGHQTAPLPAIHTHPSTQVSGLVPSSASFVSTPTAAAAASSSLYSTSNLASGAATGPDTSFGVASTPSGQSPSRN